LREVQLLREADKPVIVSMGDVAASGGYWIATYANQIFAEPTTITGSIGVFGYYANLQQLGSKVGLNWDVVKTGQTADIFTSTRPKSPQEMQILQRAVDQIYNEFLQRVTEGRDLPAAEVAEIAQGRVWSGAAAQELGLVDELGGLNTAIAAAAEIADLGEDWQLKEYPEEDGWQRFFKQLGGEPQKVQPLDPLSAQLGVLKEEVLLLRTLNDPRHIYARMPFLLELK
jgi:protease-4